MAAAAGAQVPGTGLVSVPVAALESGREWDPGLALAWVVLGLQVDTPGPLVFGQSHDNTGLLSAQRPHSG